MKCDISPGNMVFKVCFWVLFHKETEPVGPVYYPQLQTVTVKLQVEEGPGSRLCFIKFSVHQERPIEEGGLVPILKM